MNPLVRKDQTRIAQLEEALQVALALGIEAPQITANIVNADSELAAIVEAI